MTTPPALFGADLLGAVGTFKNSAGAERQALKSRFVDGEVVDRAAGELARDSVSSAQ